MGCQSSYSCPITIPTAAGTVGAAGAAGADGAAVLKNSEGTLYTSSTGSGDTVLNSYTLTAATMAAGDILEIEALFYLTSFVGEIYINFGGSKVTAYTLASGDTLPHDLISGTNIVNLKARISFSAVATQNFYKEVEIWGNPVSVLKYGGSGISEDSAANITVAVRANNTSGTAVCKHFIITKYDKS